MVSCDARAFRLMGIVANLRRGIRRTRFAQALAVISGASTAAGINLGSGCVGSVASRRGGLSLVAILLI